MTPCRLLIDGPHEGAWNMALDEVLLNQAAEQGISTLRFYQWSPATVSLGYFQRAEDRAQHEPSRTAPLVRRASGGGALIHDREITYSLALAPGHPLAKGGEPLYQAVHALLVDLLQQNYAPPGGRYELCPQAIPAEPAEPWLCFLRRAKGDVLYTPPTNGPAPEPRPRDGRYKVCGSAQRRRGGAVLQHGGLVLNRSPLAPEIVGIADLSGKPAEFDKFVPLWLERIATSLRLDGGDICGVNPDLEALANELMAAKFERPEWNSRR